MVLLFILSLFVLPMAYQRLWPPANMLYTHTHSHTHTAHVIRHAIAY